MGGTDSHHAPHGSKCADSGTTATTCLQHYHYHTILLGYTHIFRILNSLANSTPDCRANIWPSPEPIPSRNLQLLDHA